MKKLRTISKELSDVRGAAVSLIKRVGCGKATENEVKVFPQVLEFYERTMDLASSAVDKDYSDILPSSRNEFAELEAKENEFPEEGWVNARQIGYFLGFGKSKRPEIAVFRLQNEGKLPDPVKLGTKTPRWRAEEIRAHFDALCKKQRG